MNSKFQLQWTFPEAWAEYQTPCRRCFLGSRGGYIPSNSPVNLVAVRTAFREPRKSAFCYLSSSYRMGGIMPVFWFIGFFVFKLYESPKFLMGKGRDADTVGALSITLLNIMELLPA